ncbi:glycine zipper 2TM domain-containing protein [Curvibacter sp. APW13]|uniref:glycine zipper 2TM domain-containing protein n=1 Tax=Curvibacter sp. APW13 TaxID=3077236 RepID=UPI0028DE9A14|nr:glycine zipper 2TM domain-containing protein [Curvibacter sp. APW13]MDT8990226.1 glycine zipper 2TM domain-containing protein [Curvibacter sp. APW13]
MSAVLNAPVATTATPSSPWLWFVAGVMGTAGLGAGGAALYLSQHDKAAAPAAVVASAPTTEAVPAAAPTLAQSKPALDSSTKTKQAGVRTHTVQSATKNVATRAPLEESQSAPAPARPVAMPTQPVWEQAPARVACAHCGTVESVTPIAAEGKPSGMGAVAGAVLGGLLGNQFGGGDGKTLATIGGVLGGAYAGNTVEKRMNQQTSYRVLVRMDDGSTRSIELSNPSYGVGSRVSVQGNVLSPAHGAAAQGA